MAVAAFLLLVVFLIIWHYRFKEFNEKFNTLERDIAELKRKLAISSLTPHNIQQSDAKLSVLAAVSEKTKPAPAQTSSIQEPVNIPSASPVPPRTIEIPPQPVIPAATYQQTISTNQTVSETVESAPNKEKEPITVFEFEPPKPSSLELQWQEFKNNVDWEQFTGIKLFAWLGGFALFIAAIFFVKYSIDHNLIPPQVRLVISAIIGILMTLSSLKINRERYNTTAHTMAAGGIAVLYAVSFTASVYYGFIPKSAGFGLFALISAAAFVLAVFLKGRFISVLGAIGAYATPLLIQTGHPNLFGLFIYLILVNLGLFEVIRRTCWYPLTVLVTVGTLITLSAGAWGTTPPAENVLIALIAIANLVIFSLFFWIYRGQNPDNRSLLLSLRIIFLSMMVLSLFFIDTTATSVKWLPLLLVGVSILVGLIISYQEKSWSVGFILYNIIGFIIVALFCFINFDLRQPSWGMLIFFLYGFVASIGPIFVIRKHGIETLSLQWLKIFPIVLIAVALIILFKNETTSFFFWPMILGLAAIEIFISLIVGSILSVFALSILILIGGVHWIFNTPDIDIGHEFFIFLLFAGISLGLVTTIFLKKAVAWNPLAGATEIDNTLTPSFINSSAWVSALPILGPFVLLSLVLIRQDAVKPNPAMATALLFFILATSLARWIKSHEILIAALLAMTITVLSWMIHVGVVIDYHRLLLAWSSFLWLSAVVTPIFILRPEKDWKLGWYAWAIFELVQSGLIIWSSDILWKREIAGWLPLGLALLKLPVIAILLNRLEGKKERNAILAFHGGVFLFYISSVAVLLLGNAWIGLTFVLEAMLLLYLNRRIEHPGLRWVSLCLAPLGLALLLSNINTLKGTQDMPVFNLAILSFTLCTAALSISVKLADYPQEELSENFSLPQYFLWFAIGTGFFLLNLIMSDIFGGTGGGFKIYFYDDFLQFTSFTLLWTMFGAILWRVPKIPSGLRITGLILIIAGSLMALWAPFHFSQEIGSMLPIFNLALIIFIPIIAIMVYLGIAQGVDDLGGEDIKQLFISIGLALCLLAMTMQLSTVFDIGQPFNLFARQSPNLTLALTASWFIFGFCVVLWPLMLRHYFRLAGAILIIISVIRAVLYPLNHASEFGAVTPIFNIPTLVSMAIIIGLIVLTLRRFENEWTWNTEIHPRHMWGALLILFVFYVINVEVASFFGKINIGADAGRFTFYTQGRLSQQLAYSISWLIYAIGLLIIGIHWKIIQVRWIALSLFIITSLKVFIKDLSTLGQLYRVFSFVGLAVTLILVSFIYQRYLGDKKTKEKDEEG